LEPMGFQLAYRKGDGPVLSPPVRRAADVRRLREVDVERSLGFVFEAVRKARSALPPHIPLIGFAGAPFTLASYLIEGGGSRNFTLTKAFMHEEPAAWHALLSRITRVVVPYLNAQIAAGAQAVQIFDSWVGCLSPSDYRAYVLPHSRSVFRGVRGGVPVIHFGTQTASLLELMKEAGGSVIGFDWRVDLGKAWDRLGNAAVMGNLDPAVLFSSRSVIRKEVARILGEARGRRGHVFNLGHGILPETPVENVEYLVRTVKEFGARG
jgi:uroporphyrinogen decarboxylase